MEKVMGGTELEQFAEAMRAAVEAVTQCHPSLRQDVIDDLLRVREWKVALEILCDNINEDDLRLPKDVRSSLVSVAEKLGVDSRYYECIEDE